MLNLAEYRKTPRLLADYLPWGFLVGPGIVLNKDGSFLRLACYRGPDLESATEAELVGVTARINNVLKRFGSGWALFFEARRRPSTDYPFSDFPDPVSLLVDEERRVRSRSFTLRNRAYAGLLLAAAGRNTGQSRILSHRAIRHVDHRVRSPRLRMARSLHHRN